MLITAGVGLIFNLIQIKILHSGDGHFHLGGEHHHHDHNHEHGHSHGHGHHHDHHDHSEDNHATEKLEAEDVNPVHK